MNNVEVLFVDEKEIHLSNLKRVENVQNKLYFFDCTEELGQYKIQNFGNIYSDKYKKEIVGIEGYFNDVVVMGPDIFLFDYDYLCKFDEKNKLADVYGSELTGQEDFAFSSMATDGKKLYLKSEKTDEILVVDKNFNLENKIKLAVEELYSGNNICFMEKELKFHRYSEGKRKRGQKISKLKHNSLDEKVDLVYDLESDGVGEFEMSMELSKLNYPVGRVTGNEGMYYLMSQGNIFYPTKNGGINLEENWSFGENFRIGSTFNENYTFLFDGKRVGIFDGPKKIHENALEIDILNIANFVADKEFIYALTKENTLQRYKILF